MIEENTKLVRYSVTFFDYEEYQEEIARMALSGLLVTAARAVEDGKPEDLAEYSEITITLQKKGWNKEFVFELKAIEESEQVLFIEFATSEYYEGLKPFALAMSDDRRYDVDYSPKDEVLIYRCCASGKFYPFCYLENAEHLYWAAEDIAVMKKNGQPAPPENRIELPEKCCEYQGGKLYWMKRD